MLWRWSQSDESKTDPDYASLKVFDIIGYAKTATSPQEAKPLLFLDKNSEIIINRNKLIPFAKTYIKNNIDFSPPKECSFILSVGQGRKKMTTVLEDI